MIARCNHVAQGDGGPALLQRRELPPERGGSDACRDVENPLALPRVPLTDPQLDRDRPVLSVTTAPSGLEGEGFPVRRAFHGVDLRALDPFIHMDQMGEVEYAPG